MLEDVEVLALIKGIGGDSARVVDLGGTMSLNAHLVADGLVVRVHPQFVSPERVSALQDVRRRLIDLGLIVGEPVSLSGQDVFDVGGRVAEVESYVEAERRPCTPESYMWMFEAMGHLHRSLALICREVPEPGASTWGPPSAFRSHIEATAAAVAGDPEAESLAAWAVELGGLLRDTWVAEAALPTQLIHGDVRLGNVGEGLGGTVYFDFGFAARRPRVFDLAYSLSWIILKPDDSGAAHDFDWGSVPELIDAYEAGARTTVTTLERKALVPYLASVPLHLVSIAGDTPEPAERIKVERPFLAIADWVLRHPQVLA